MISTLIIGMEELDDLNLDLLYIYDSSYVEA